MILTRTTLYSKYVKVTVEPVYSGHPQDPKKWLLCRGDLLACDLLAQVEG